MVCLERDADCLRMIQLMPLLSPNPHHLLPHLNPGWFLPFWYQLTQVVQEKRLLNGCNSSNIEIWNIWTYLQLLQTISEN